MQTETTQPSGGSKAAYWIGWVLSVLPSLMLLYSGYQKLSPPDDIAKNMAEVGWTKDQLVTLAILELGSLVLYLIPQTAVLGAILLTGYLGGAIATHVRINDPLFVIPLVLGLLVWGGLYLRDRRLRALIPLRL